jgi:putative heme transporter
MGVERSMRHAPERAERGRREFAPEGLRRASELGWRFLVVAAAVVVLALLLARLRIVLVPAAVALLAACALWPLATRLRGVGIPQALAALLLLLALVGTVAVAVAVLAPRAAHEFDQLDVTVTGGVDEIQDWFTRPPLNLPGARVSSFFDRAEQEARDAAGNVVGGAVGGAMLALEVVVAALLTLVLSFFFLKDGDRLWAWCRTALLARWDDADEAGQRVRDVLAGYVRGTAIVALVDAVAIGFGLYLLGVPLVIPLAVLTFFGGFVPLVGATVAGFAAIMVALFARGVAVAVAALALVLGVQQLEGHVLQPFVVGRQVRLHPVVVLLAVSVGSVLWGIAGAFLAVPLTAAVSAAWNPDGDRGSSRTGRR